MAVFFYVILLLIIIKYFPQLKIGLLPDILPNWLQTKALVSSITEWGSWGTSPEYLLPSVGEGTKIAAIWAALGHATAIGTMASGTVPCTTATQGTGLTCYIPGPADPALRLLSLSYTESPLEIRVLG